MNIFYYFDEQRPEKEKTVVQSIYGDEVIFINERPWSVVDRFTPGDFLICNSVDELADSVAASEDIEAIIKEYINILSRDVELIFDRSTQCNSLFIKTLTNSEQDFESVLRKCVMNYASQKDIAAKYAKKHVVTARANGNRVGLKKGTKLTTKKSVQMKEKIREYSQDFNGVMRDSAVIERLGIARNSYYKYKKELREEAD